MIRWWRRRQFRRLEKRVLRQAVERVRREQPGLARAFDKAHGFDGSREAHDG